MYDYFYQEENFYDNFENYSEYNYSPGNYSDYGNYTGFDDIPWFDIPSVTETRIIPGIFIAIFVTGFFGNSLVLYVFIRNKHLRTVTNMFLVNLTIVDMVYICFCIPFSIATAWTANWPFGDFGCKVANYLSVTCMSVSTLTLIGVGVDRYFAIVHPVFTYSCRHTRRTVLEILSIWIISLLSSIPVLKVSEEIDIIGRKYCIESWNHEQQKAYTTVITIIFYVLPQLILSFCYIQIARKMRRSMRSQQSQLTAVTMKIRRRVVKMVFVVTITFAIGWLPLHLTAVNSAFNISNSVFFFNLRLFSPCFSYLTTAINPVIYCFLSKTFRKFFKATFTCKKVVVNVPLVGEDAEAFVRLAMTPLQHTSRPVVNNPRTLLIQVRPAANVYVGSDVGDNSFM